jgi:replication factor C large subunit
MKTLCDKYQAECFADLIGREKAITKVKDFIKNFPNKKALTLHGPAGTGKTSLVHTLAKETNSEIIEINASDLRNKEEIKKVLGQSSKQKSLFNENKILLVDEIDGICRKDYGAIPELIRLIKETNFPIILTANDIWDRKFSKLRRKTELVELKSMDYQKVLVILNKISKKENLNLPEDILKSISIKTKGDVRAAINDLQTINRETEHKDIHERDKGDTIFNVLKQIFQNPPSKKMLWLYDKVNLPLDKIFLWVEENIPNEYRGEELYNAFEALSKADVFRGRIYRQQHWRFLVYENFLLSIGIAASKKSGKSGFTRYKKPGRILKIWLIKRKQKYKKSISEKYAELTHISKKRAMREFGIIKQLLKNKEVKKELDLDDKEIEFLKN